MSRAFGAATLDPEVVVAHAPESGWPLGRALSDYVLGDVRAVLPDRVLDRARIVVEGGRITAVEPHPGGFRADLDGRGMLALPGLVDCHSDALEIERLPRPTAPLPWDFAIASFEAKLRAAGVTTIFHGAGFRTKQVRGGEGPIEHALHLCEVVDAQPDTAVDHRVLHRLDLYTLEGKDALAARLDALAAQASAHADGEPAAPPPLVSHEDHTPGRGQYADPEYLVAYMMGADGRTRAEAEALVEEMRREAEEAEPVRREILDWVTRASLEGRIRLLGHDPDSAEAIDELATRGVQVAEFPTTLEAAERATELGMLTVAGAPNLMRGGSHSGNVSAVELASRGLLDALASDYMPSALLGATRDAARLVGLPAAVGFVTSGPARVAGLEDRGALVPGKRADLVIVDDSRGPWLRPVETLTAVSTR